MPSPNPLLESTPKPVNQQPPVKSVPPVNPEPPSNPEPPTNPEPPVNPKPPAKPKPPTASFIYAPKAPVAGQAVVFNASSSSCPDGTCSYEWSDDGSPAELSSPLWPLGAGKTLTYTFSEADTKYVRLMVTEGSSGQASTVVHDVVVEESEPEPPPTEPPPTEPPPTEPPPSEPPPPAPPKNTALPSLSGSAVEGQTLSATKGTWTGSPTSYAYQWESCNSAGASCSNVSGATAASYKLLAEAVNHTMRVVVKASNAGGSTSASSAATATVTSVGTNPNPGEPSLSAKGCFENPETEGTSRIEACGYPGGHNTGVEKSALEKGLEATAGTIRLTGEEHYEDKRLNGSIIVAWNAKNVVIKNDEITSDGLCSPTPPYSIANGCTGNAIEFERESDSNDEAAKGTVISHVKVGGSEIKGPNTVQTCVDARWNSPYVAEYVDTEDCSGFKLNAGGELNHDYCPSNYEIEEEHYECVTDEGESLAKTPLVVKDSTIFTPQTTTITAALFLQGLYGPIQEVRLEDNLMAGGNYIIDGGEEAGHDKLVGPLVVTDNRFARCLSSSCPDSHGFWEEGGQYKVQAFTNEALTTWTHNFWDDNLEECVYGVGACY